MTATEVGVLEVRNVGTASVQRHNVCTHRHNGDTETTLERQKRRNSDAETDVQIGRERETGWPFAGLGCTYLQIINNK